MTFYCDIRGVLQSYLDMSQTTNRFVPCEDDTFFLTNLASVFLSFADPHFRSVMTNRTQHITT